MVERVIRVLTEQCVRRRRFDSIQDATRVIGDWISFYNHHRPHQGWTWTPRRGFASAA
jgi:putative transposase